MKFVYTTGLNFCLLLCILLIHVSSRAQVVGSFESHADIGINLLPGAATYIPETRQYIISGAGYNVWGDHDEFHFAWKKIKGDFIVTCRAAFAGCQGTDAHRKIGWMARTSSDSNSAHVNAVVHGDGLTSLQYRKTKGAETEENKLSVTHADVLELERRGNKYFMRAARFGEPYSTIQVSDIDLGEELLVGLFVGSHNSNVLETGVFSNVRIVIPAPDSLVQYRQYLGSNIEILHVFNGNREIIHTSPQSLQAPNWTPDNKKLIYNSGGLIYTLDLQSRKTDVLNTGDVRNNNNDHVLSFDGKMLGLSSGVQSRGGSVIYTVPVEGGTPQLITPVGPSYLHGWSPDNKYLTYTAQRNNEYDIYRIPAQGGKEERLTDAKGLDDGSEYTPDGKYIYFNSDRTGTMQIWRMLADGSHQEAVTKGDFHDWFPHISPDGKWIVFLSFLKEEVKSNDHPFYKHVYLRMMPVNGGEPKVIAYFYGGQGSINTPSWSPDSKRIAFISNSLNIE